MSSEDAAVEAAPESQETQVPLDTDQVIAAPEDGVNAESSGQETTEPLTAQPEETTAQSELLDETAEQPSDKQVEETQENTLPDQNTQTETQEPENVAEIVEPNLKVTEPAEEGGLGSPLPSTAAEPSPSLSPQPKELDYSSEEDNQGYLKSSIHKWYNKKYLGGYRHKHQGTEFFHACTQTTTPQEIRAMRAIERFHRDTQTIETKNSKAQSTAEHCTQMSKKGCYVSVEEDKIIKPRPYVTAEQHHQMIVEKVILLQCFFRKTLARIKTKKMRQMRDQRLKQLQEKERKRYLLAEKKKQREIEARLHPSKIKDFEILYNGLEKWRVQETNRINSLQVSEPARLAALADLMDQECALLQKIDKLKITANTENKEKHILKLLEHMASPKKWLCSDQKYVYVDTPHTIRARELRDLYHALNLPMLSVDERLQILLHVKYTTKEFDCNLTREIVSLIDREGDLVSRGRPEQALEGLRKRISSLFLQFIKTPEFNPEAAHHLKFSLGQQSVYYCHGCASYKPSTEFYLSTTINKLGRCKMCTNDQNVAFDRSNDTLYDELLKLVLIQEAHKQGGHHAVYNAMSLLQGSDMRYIIDVLWNRQSAISGPSSLEALTLTRWNPDEELSPWNCICLTKQEAVTHDALKKASSQAYAPDFCQRVHQKHMIARKHFEALPEIREYVREHYIEDEEGKLHHK